MILTFKSGGVTVTCCNQTAKLAATGVISCNRCGDEADVDAIRAGAKVEIEKCAICHDPIVVKNAPIIYDDESGEIEIGREILEAPVYLCSSECDKKLQEECR